jgi:hypothetical protein
MPDGWEISNGLSPTVANAFEDKDGDRYPNVFEYVNSTDPSNAASTPSPTYVVNAGGGGTHTTIAAALTAANVTNGAYQIIGIAAGTYKGAANLHDVSVASTKPKLLVLGLDGAAKTIIDGERANWGWIFNQSVVVSSLTFQNTWVALYVDAAGKETRFVDLVVRDNTNGNASQWTAGVHVHNGARTHIVGSTFLNNAGGTTGKQIFVNAGTASLTNTVVTSASTGTMLASAGGVTLTTSYCHVKGQTLTGTGNLSGSIDPKLRADARLRSDSPLRAAGGTVPQSRVDFDGELRPSSTPDIGADQFVDTDSDSLPDAWEINVAGNTTSVSGAADEDDDGLSNLAEYDLETNWLDPDTDRDGIDDGPEVSFGTNPLIADVDDIVSDLNGDGVLDNIGGQIGHQPNESDDDSDGVSNADELLMCTNPFRADTDGDGISDNTDVFPHDPLMSALPTNSSDTTAPVITLTTPWYAVLQ